MTSADEASVVTSADEPSAVTSADEASAVAPLHRVLIVGTGLIGTSIALALREAGVVVHLLDRNGAAAKLAAALGAGTADAPSESADLAVLAVPPSSVGSSAATVLDSGLAVRSPTWPA